MLLNIIKYNKLLYFLFIVFIQICLSYFVQSTFFLKEEVFSNSYADIMTYERIGELLENAKKYSWISLVMIPFLLFIKVTFNSFILLTGTLLFSDEFSFSKLFNVCLKTEVVFLFMLIFKIILFTFFISVNNLSEIGFIPLSLANLFSSNNIPKWCIYPFQLINLWELSYCFLGANLFAIQFNIDLKRAFSLFCGSYLVGLFVLILLSIFITISFT